MCLSLPINHVLMMNFQILLPKCSIFQDNGPNALAPPAEISNLKLYLRQFLNLFWVLLIGAAILSMVTYALNTEYVRF